MKKIRLYPLAQRSNPPPQNYIDVSGKLIDGMVPFDDGFYASLAKMVNEEPVQNRDLVAIGQLRSLGIEKGKPFNPDDATKAILKQAAQEAHEQFMLAVRGGDPWFPGTHWVLIENKGAKTGFSFMDNNTLYLDERAVIYYLTFALPKQLGAATFYVVAANDSHGQQLSGEKTYRLHVPPNPPAKQYWATTAYDLDTACLIRDMSSPGLDSYNQKMHRNTDGSVDIYYGPKSRRTMKTTGFPQPQVNRGSPSSASTAPTSLSLTRVGR